MVGRKVLTLCLCNRPDYTREVFRALANCRGIENYLILPHVEPGNDEVRREVEAVQFAECLPTFNATRLGVNQNTENALLDGFGFADFVIHVEDDILLAADALDYFEWANGHYRLDPEIFSVTSYHRRLEPADLDDYHRVGRRRWFHPWGWATWKDRWELFSGLLLSSPTGWDVYLNVAHCFGGLTPRGYEIFPELSRSQNIGEISTTSSRPASWYRTHHRLRHWAGDVEVAPGAFREWA